MSLFTFYMGGGGSGGGGSAPANQNYTTSNIAPWAQTGVESLINSAMQNVYPNQTTNPDGTINLGAQKGYVPFNANATDPASQQAMKAGMSTVAPSTALQNQSYNSASNMQMPGQIADASNMAQQAGIQSLNSQYNPMSAGYNQVQGSQAGIAQLGNAPQASVSQGTAQNAQAAQGSAQDAQASQLGNAPIAQASQFGGPQNVNAQNVGTQDYTGQNVQNYMSPYMQNVVNSQMYEANRNYDISGANSNAQATQQGAFGGGRNAVMQAENERNRNTALEGIQAQGAQNAFQNAQQQFNTQQQANLQAQQANQGANLQAGLANQNMGFNTGLQNAQLSQQANLANQALQGQYGLTQGQFGQATNLANQQAQNQFGMANLSNQQQANMANQQYGNQFGLANMQAQNQAGLANQALQGQYGLQQGQFNQQGNQFNAANIQQANLANQQAQLQAQQANIGQQQFGANYGLQALNQANTAASNLGNLGGQQLAAQQGIAGLQNQLGTQQQQNTQTGINNAAQQYAQMQNAPFNQLAQLESLYTGAPQNTSQLGYQAPPSMVSQIGGLGAAGLGAYGLYNAATKAKGGIIKYHAGGIVSLGLNKAMKGKL